MTLDARDITLRLAGRVILHEVSCQAVPGRITAVVGPNGAGKSTLLKAMAGLLTPDGGAVTLDARPLASIDKREVARRIAYLPQDRTVHWPMTVERIVALGRLPHHGDASAAPGQSDKAAVQLAMRAMDVTALAHRPVLQLSGGERARVLVARALAQESGTLIADEPTAGLDPAHALELFATFERLASEGRAIVIALHDLTFAARFCHHVVLLVAGRVAAAGPADDIVQPGPLSAAFGATMVRGVLGGVPVVVAVAPRSS